MANKKLAEKIMEQRKKTLYELHDNKIQFEDMKEIFVLSFEFWSFFRDHYGCDVTI